jgi:glutamate synthase (NADPH) large chain
MTGGRVIILGSTGRNFAAGMSGGVAFVYDVKSQFSTLCNKEMIDLDQLEEEDVQWLHSMIAKHYQYTASTVAKFLLDDFENQIRNFVKVFPKDYKRVLKDKKEKVNVG